MAGHYAHFERFDPLAILADIVTCADDGQGLTVGDTVALAELHKRLSALMARDATAAAELAAPLPYDSSADGMAKLAKAQASVASEEWIRDTGPATFASWVEDAR